MIRPILIEIGLFLAPFVIYAAIRIATGAGVLQPAAWTVPRLSALAIAALVLLVGSFVIFAQFSGAPPGSTYVPAHMEGGKFIPGATR
jgi:heme/copper-type cytochrome/quinol oxidase subunit 3